jgi:acyl-coenzyme A synthetase/AMP-(fatty) acid ligase/acyl carrier protein
VGIELVMARPQGHQDARYLAEEIGRTGITTLHFVPSMLQVFLEHADLRHCTSLRRVLCSGEALSPALQQRFFDLLPQVELHNLYGPTEAAIDVTAWPCAPDADAVTVPIGRPVANTRIYLLDQHRQPVPLGVAGELTIGGAQVARGYLNRLELTAERFLPDPFSADPHARMYKTGDLARYRADGVIEYLGRNDFQVKIRGVRIELGEIEARLSSCEGVREAVVVACADGQSQRLVAYLLAVDPADPPTPATLRGALAASLPEHMVPSAFIVLDAFPLTPNGKLDRNALPAPDQSSVAVRVYSAPQGETETLLALLWQELLNLPQVGRDDHFFELGGHSLMAIQLIARVKQHWQIDLPMNVLFYQPTLADLAHEIVSLQIKAFTGEDMDQQMEELNALSRSELLALLQEDAVDE